MSVIIASQLTKSVLNLIEYLPIDNLKIAVSLSNPIYYATPEWIQFKFPHYYLSEYSMQVQKLVYELFQIPELYKELKFIAPTVDLIWQIDNNQLLKAITFQKQSSQIHTEMEMPICLNGRITNVINGIAILMNQSPNNIINTDDIFQMVQRFTNSIKKRDLSIISNMPQYIIHNSEFDDMLLWALLLYLSKQLNQHIKAYVQINPNDGMIIYENYYKYLRRIMSGISILFDYDSKNSQQIIADLMNSNDIKP